MESRKRLKIHVLVVAILVVVMWLAGRMPTPLEDWRAGMPTLREVAGRMPTPLEMAGRMLEMAGRMPTPLEAAENPGWYMHYEHLSMVSVLDSHYCKAAGICTLGVFAIDAINEESADGYVDSTRDAYLMGVNTFVFNVDIDSVSGDTIQIDSLWWNIRSVSGLGPLKNADTTSVMIGVNIVRDTMYGPFAKQVYNIGRMYPLRILRGQGILYIMANWTTADTGVVWSELWRARS